MWLLTSPFIGITQFWESETLTYRPLEIANLSTLHPALTHILHSGCFPWRILRSSPSGCLFARAAGTTRARRVPDPHHGIWHALWDVLSSIHTQSFLWGILVAYTGDIRDACYVMSDVKECYFSLKFIFQVFNMPVWMQSLGTILYSQRAHRMI